MVAEPVDQLQMQRQAFIGHGRSLHDLTRALIGLFPDSIAADIQSRTTPDPQQSEHSQTMLRRP